MRETKATHLVSQKEDCGREISDSEGGVIKRIK